MGVGAALFPYRLLGVAMRALPARRGADASRTPSLHALWWRFNLSLPPYLPTAHPQATSLDVNVDGQTRERDVDAVDAAFNALGQFAVFGARDDSIQRRTMLEMFTNDTDMWTQVGVGGCPRHERAAHWATRHGRP